MPDLTGVRLFSLPTDTSVVISVSRIPVQDERIMYNGMVFHIPHVIILSGGGAICYTENVTNLEVLSCLDDQENKS